MKIKKYSFRKGWDQVPGGLQSEVKAKIMKALDIHTLPSWLARLNGNIEPKVSECERIEKVFGKYNVTEVWGTGKTKKTKKQTV